MTNTTNCIECNSPLRMYYRFRKCDVCEPIHFADIKVGDLVEKYHNGSGFVTARYRQQLKVLKVTPKRIETNRGKFERSNGKELGERYNHLIHADEVDKYSQYNLSKYFEPVKLGGEK